MHFLKKVEKVLAFRKWDEQDENTFKKQIFHISDYLKQIIGDKIDDKVHLHGNRIVGINECIKELQLIVDDLKNARESAKKALK